MKTKTNVVVIANIFSPTGLLKLHIIWIPLSDRAYGWCPSRTQGLVEYALFHDTQSSNMSWNIVQYRQFPIGPRGINFFWSCKNKIVSVDRRGFKDSKNIKISHKSYLELVVNSFQSFEDINKNQNIHNLSVSFYAVLN